MHLWRGLHLGRPLGIPLLVHGSWFPAAVLLVVALSLNVYDGEAAVTAVLLASGTALGMFVSLVIHELAHAQVAQAIGIPVRDITLFIFGGVARINKEPSKPAQEAAIAVAGPVASLVLAGAILLFAGDDHLGDVLRVLSVGNLALALFNLIPGYPLDGGRLLRAWLWSRNGDPHRSAIRASMAGQVFAVIMIVSGLGIAWKQRLGEALWLPVIGGFLYVLASAARRASRVTSRLARQAAGGFIRPVTGTLTGEESVAYVRSNGGGPYAVVSSGRLEGVLLPGSLGPEIDPFARAREVMVQWNPRITCSDRLPMSRALERLDVAPDGVLIIVDDTGAMLGILDHASVRRKLEAVT